MFIFDIRNEVTCVWKGHLPLVIYQCGVPTHMISMQMGAHDKIDILRRDPYRAKARQVSSLP